VSSYDEALDIEPDDEYAWYNQACCYALLGNTERAIASLQEAITLNPEEYQTLAKTDPDLNNLRDNKQFQALLLDWSSP
jgi:tetratricopeptide (TPR) repeat protein